MESILVIFLLEMKFDWDLIWVGDWICFYSTLLINGWDSNWFAVMRFVGSHFRHYEMKSRASLGHYGIAVPKDI